MQLFKADDLVADEFLHQHLVMPGLVFQTHQTFPKPQTSHLDVLGRHQHILVKQGDLDASASHFNNRGPLFYDLQKILFYGRNGFVAQESLLRIAQDMHLDSCILIDLSQNDLGVSRLPKSAGGAGPVVVHLVFLHDPLKIIQHAAQLLHQLIADLSPGVCVLSQLHAVIHMVQGFQAILPGYLENLHGHIVGTHVNGCKCECLHSNHLFHSLFFVKFQSPASLPPVFPRR